MLRRDLLGIFLMMAGWMAWGALHGVGDVHAAEVEFPGYSTLAKSLVHGFAADAAAKQAYHKKMDQAHKRAKLDPQRPRWHFTPPVYWMNDPNGLIQWQGSYHLFYQYDADLTTDTSKCGLKRWGHASSKDLVHWQHQPVALMPTPGGPDQGGAWSGSIVVNNGVPTAIYTGVNFEPYFKEKQCLATSSGDLTQWEKHPANPVDIAPPPGLPIMSFRDPYVWREKSFWYMALGSGLHNQGPAVLLFRSTDLTHWVFVRTLFSVPKERYGEVLECPNFLPLGDRQVLVGRAIPSLYSIGFWQNETFEPKVSGRLDLFDGIAASQVFIDDRGRRVMISWVDEARDKEASREAGWSGAMTFPRVLSLTPDGDLAQRPAEELVALRNKHQHQGPLELAPDQTLILPEIHGDKMEIAVRFEPGCAKQVGLILRRSPDGKEQTRIIYDTQAKRLIFDGGQSSLDARVRREVKESPLTLVPGKPLELRIYLDRSVLELFTSIDSPASAGVARIYPSRADSIGVAVFANGGRARITSLDCWQLK